ncbi:unnamed protein product [Closterium sp. Naga37s-1]|nr:unnamed protein product [Closterium sp. Naga37s-1]
MSLAAPTLQPLAPRFLRRSLRALPPSALRGRPLTLPPSYARGSSSRLAQYLSSRAELSATSVSAEAAPAGVSADGTSAEAEQLRSSGAGESGKTPKAGTLTPNGLIPPCALPPLLQPIARQEYWAGVGCAVLQPSSTEEYWAGVGCAVLQPSSTEVGAGTMNPATFLRVLGPEAWRVAYVEPSMRPDDSRFGDNPNRVQRHTQFQVILKPDPGNAQELYLGSLAALGIDSKQHDVRFVEDNWESPVLGAWGLGWEVWLDGMEITQFTYFQQAGGMPLSPVSVEITYGLERIIMSLQGVDHFKRIAYAPGVTYGELFLENEREMSCFNMEEADTERVKQRFDLYDAEAQALIDKQLAIPAFDHVLKTSHAFNILDARGAVGVTERARFFGRMRSLARQCAQLWVDTREKLGFPLGRADADVAQPTGDTWPSADVAAQDGAASAGGVEAREGEGRMLVVEIGTEELPPDDVSSAVAQSHLSVPPVSPTCHSRFPLCQLLAAIPPLLTRLRLPYDSVQVEGTLRRVAVQLQAAIPPLLTRLRLPYSSVRVEGTPRRVAVQVAGLAAWQQREQREALEGFCKRNAVTAEAVTTRADDKGVEYVWASVSEESRPAWAVLGEQLPAVIAGIAFPKTMRWNSQVAARRHDGALPSFTQPQPSFLHRTPAPHHSAPQVAFTRPMRWLLAMQRPHCGALSPNPSLRLFTVSLPVPTPIPHPSTQVAFSRPIRWLLAMHGHTVVPFAYAGLASGNESWLLRNAPETRVQVSYVLSMLYHLQRSMQQPLQLPTSPSPFRCAPPLSHACTCALPIHVRASPHPLLPLSASLLHSSPIS